MCVCVFVCVWEGPPYLDNNCLDAGHVRVPGRVLLHLLAWRMHRHQNARVRRDNDAAGQHVAEGKERHSVGARRAVLIGPAPVDATGSAVGFGAVLPPVGQRGASEQKGVEPSAGDEPTAVNGVKPVPCQNKASLSFTEMKSSSSS